MEFDTIADFLQYTDTSNGLVIAAELTETSIPIDTLPALDHTIGNIFVVVGNEVTGVEQETLNRVPMIVHIPMQGIKESLNV
jgi:tRNA G18 (ribose-2'-O)-methylase SpoU